MAFLTPLAALAALAALVPVAAGLAGRRRAAALRHQLGLSAPRRSADVAPLAAAAVAIGLLGLAAAQPVLTHESALRIRTGVQVLFVLDTSRSMAASSGPGTPTRLDRARRAALRLRAAVPGVAAGVATLTDRVLPDLLPVAGTRGFDAVVQRVVRINSPPPVSSSFRITTYQALAGIGSGNFFAARTGRRIVVLLSDGETRSFDASAVARALPARRGYRFLALRFWRPDERVYAGNGRPEPDYRPDPAGGPLMAGLSTVTGGRFFDEGGIGAASAYLRSVSDRGPTVTTRLTAPGQTPLAPYIAGISLLAILGSFAPWTTGGALRRPRAQPRLRRTGS